MLFLSWFLKNPVKSQDFTFLLCPGIYPNHRQFISSVPIHMSILQYNLKNRNLVYSTYEFWHSLENKETKFWITNTFLFKIDHSLATGFTAFQTKTTKWSYLQRVRLFRQYSIRCVNTLIRTVPRSVLCQSVIQ